MYLKTILLMFLFFTFSCSLFKRNQETPLADSLEEAVESSSRSEENVERDEYQHPLETLNFFGVKPEMTVVEISPGAGYYTEILAPYLTKKGQYVMAVPRMPSNPPPFLVENEKKLQDILLGHREMQARARFIPFEPLNERNRTKPNFADMVIAFNSVHNWVATESEAESFKLFYDILKPGGILGITQHRGRPGKILPKSGYMTEREVISLASKAGFKLMEKSEVNANPRDTADYPDGVWTLPPFYRLGDKDRDKYEDIGESDRMTLKFRRP